MAMQQLLSAMEIKKSLSVMLAKVFIDNVNFNVGDVDISNI